MLIEEHDCYLGGLFTSAPTRTVTDCAILPALNLAQWPNRNIGGKDQEGGRMPLYKWAQGQVMCDAPN